jgi:prepilin-type processing-associated H-X9-DG protein
MLGLGGLLGWAGNNYVLQTVLESDVVAPSEMIAMTDYDPLVDDDGDGDFHPDLLFTISLTGSRHSSSANVIFCDAHVEFAKTNMMTLRYGPFRPRWNNDQQPHLELP